MSVSASFATSVRQHADASISTSYGGAWNRTLFQPLIKADSPRKTVHIVMTLVSSEEYRPDFSSAAGWLQKNGGSIPELCHFVSMSSDSSESQELALGMFESLAQAARESCRDAEAAANEAAKEADEHQQSLLKKELDKVKHLRTIDRGESPVV